LGKEVIVIPDQDKAGLMLIKQAIDYGWSVAFPTWDDHVKDCADAVQTYGKLFVTVDIIKTAQQGEIKISVARNNLETRLALHEER
jgi:DNA primase